MGNSEVGHMSLGAGRIVYQSITRIDQAIRAGDFETNAAYLQAIDEAVTTDKAVHIMGLLSPGGVHSHEEHLFAAIRLAASAVRPKSIYTPFSMVGIHRRAAQHPLSRALNRCSHPLGSGVLPRFMGVTGLWTATIAGSASSERTHC